MAHPDDNEQMGPDETSDTSAAPGLPLGRKRGLSEPKGRRADQAQPATTWANMQPVSISEQFRRIATRRASETSEKWGPTMIGRLAGYADHAQASEIMRGSNDDHGLVRIANALGCELMAVPRGTAESLLARLQQANQRELLVVIEILDLLMEFRDEPRLIEGYEAEVPFLRERYTRLRPRGGGAA